MRMNDSTLLNIFLDMETLRLKVEVEVGMKLNFTLSVLEMHSFMDFASVVL